MGEHSSKRKKNKREKTFASSSQSSSESDDDIETSDDNNKRSRHKRRRRGEDERSSRKRSSSRSDKHRDDRKKKEKKHRKKRKHSASSSGSRRSKREGKRKYSDSDTTESDSGSDYDDSPTERPRQRPEDLAKRILQEFPAVAGDLKQLLQLIDDGQAVDISGLSERLLVKHLRKLFLSLNLKETGDNIFLLPSKASPTLETLGAIICSQMQIPSQELHQNDEQTKPLDSGGRQEGNNANLSVASEEATAYSANLHLPNDKANKYNANLCLPAEEVTGPKKRVIGPAIPSADLLAAAARLTEAQAELRDVQLEEDNEFFIGPPPPALVIEAESANEAERFEEVTRIMGAEVDNLYDVLGVNRNMASDKMKKRYWKLSLLVHPDKCSHPEANQAFVKLNKAFKDLQDPDKRKVLDDKIKKKEEQEEQKAELHAMREAAQWRRLQGISMEGDDLLLAEMEVNAAPKRDEWMTTLPPERRPGVVTMHSTTTFSKSSKEGRGDTSAWTDTPSDRAQRAKMNYLEAYDKASALASKEEENCRTSVDAELVEQYNKAKRSKSLVEKHLEKTRTKTKKKSKQDAAVTEEWEGSHPWKPWDREKDLTAGRQNVKLDGKDMAQGLTSRFSSGSFQRNFL